MFPFFDLWPGVVPMWPGYLPLSPAILGLWWTGWASYYSAIGRWSGSRMGVDLCLGPEWWGWDMVQMLLFGPNMTSCGLLTWSWCDWARPQSFYFWPSWAPLWPDFAPGWLAVASVCPHAAC
ncbi:hypothetical protein R6Q59_002966 [Mikania micrantha]